MARILPPSVFKADFQAAKFAPTQTQRVAERFATPEGLKIGVDVVDRVGGTIKDAVSEYAAKRALIAAGKDPSQYSYEAGMGEVAKAQTPETRAAGYDKMRRAFNAPRSGRLLSDPARASSRLIRQDYEALAKSSPLPQPGSGKAPAFFTEADTNLKPDPQLVRSLDTAVSLQRVLRDGNGDFQPVDLTKAVPSDVRSKLIQSGAYVPYRMQDSSGQMIDTVRLRNSPEQEAELATLVGAEKEARLRLFDRANFDLGLALMRDAGNPNLLPLYKRFTTYQGALSALQGFRQAKATPENIKRAQELRSILGQSGFGAFKGFSLGNLLQSYVPPKEDGSGGETASGSAADTGAKAVRGDGTPVDSVVKAKPKFSPAQARELAELRVEKGVNSKEYQAKLAEYRGVADATASMDEASTEGLRAAPDLLGPRPELKSPPADYLSYSREFAGQFGKEDEAALQAAYPETQRNIDAARMIERRLSDPSDPAYIPDQGRPAKSDLGLGEQTITRGARDAAAIRRPGYESLISSDTKMMPRERVQRRKRLARLEERREPQRQATDARTLAARRRATAQMAGRMGPLTEAEVAGDVAALPLPQAAGSAGPQAFKKGSLTRAQVIKMATIPRSEGKDLVPGKDRVNDLMADLARNELYKPNPNPKGEKIGGTPELRAMASKAAKKHGVPEALFLALINKESRFRPSSVSHMNAIGIAQMLPSTFRDVMGKNAKASDLFKPEIALDASAKHMARLLKKFKGKDGIKKAIAAYNAGEGNVRRRGLYGFQMVTNKKTGKPYKLYGVLEPQFASGQTRDYLFDKQLGIYNKYKESLKKKKAEEKIAAAKKSPKG